MTKFMLDQKDRLILANQYRILEQVCPDEAGDFAKKRQIVEKGFTLLYSSLSEEITSERPLDENECREVLDILEMYRSLNASYTQLADKTGIAEGDIKFQGFDANNEDSYLSFCEFFIRDMGRYEEFRNAGDDLNSHSQMIEMYRRMLAAWKPLRQHQPLTKADIQQIVAEQVHPSPRQ